MWAFASGAFLLCRQLVYQNEYFTLNEFTRREKKKICYNETQYNTSLLLPLYIYTQILTSKLKKTVVKGLTGDVD